MRNRWAIFVVPVACAGLVGCDFAKSLHSPAPTGQVVATVNGKEITLIQLHAEMNNASFPNAKARKVAEEATLQNIVGREILAKEARDEGLDKTPEFSLQKERAEETLLAQALQQKVASSVPAPTHEEAVQFVASHPDIFDQRKIFLVNQIRIRAPSDPSILKSLEPLKSLADVEAFLVSQHIEYQKVTDKIDAVGADPRLVDAIVKLPPDEIFVFPANGVLLINQITDTQIVPFVGDPAVKYAQATLQSQRTQEAVSREMKAIMDKAAPGVRFNPAYQPPKPTPLVQPAGSSAPSVASPPQGGSKG